MKDLIAINTPPISRESDRAGQTVKTPSEKTKAQPSAQATNVSSQESTVAATKDFLKRNVEVNERHWFKCDDILC